MCNLVFDSVFTTVSHFLFSWIILEEERHASSLAFPWALGKRSPEQLPSNVLHSAMTPGADETLSTWLEMERLLERRNRVEVNEGGRKKWKEEGKKMVSHKDVKDIGKIWTWGSWSSGKWVSITLSTSHLFFVHAHCIGNWRAWLFILTRMWKWVPHSRI